jgi:pimeloyl-ACP methyl ester carboxylesterase
MPEMQIDGKRVYYHDGGVAWQTGRPAVVFIHGAGGDHFLWQAQSRALAHHGYNVAVLELPGHGASEDVPAIASVEDYAHWVLRLLNALGIPHAHLVGHSLGAAIAVTLAARHGQIVRSLALIGAGLEMKANANLLKDCLENHPRAVAFVTSFGHGRATHIGGAPMPGAWVLGASRAVLSASVPAVLQRDFSVCNQWNGAALAPTVRCPTLVLSGAGDRMTAPKSGKQLADAIPGARYEMLPVTGHMSPTEAPRLVLKKLMDWLGSVSAQAA